MKVLLSAYACDPYRGSEPAVGWNWAWHLAQQGHDVWVVTRSAARSVIECFMADQAVGNLHFEYVDSPWFAYYHALGGVYPHYYLWQWLAYRRARHLHRQIGFDRVHHVTYVSVRTPSFMWRLRIPFVFGPLAGGETVPIQLRKSFPLRGRIKERVRDVANGALRYDPMVLAALYGADTIAVTSDQTRNLLPRRFRQRAIVQLGIGLPDSEAIPVSPESQTGVARCRKTFRVLYVGLLQYLKGLHLGLRAFADMHTRVPEANLTIIGRGTDSQWVRELVCRLNLGDAVQWVPWMARAQLLDMYADFDVLLFPSLRDSGGMVVLEALSRGLPVVSLDLGGPGVIVDESCGRVVMTSGLSEAAVIRALEEELVNLAKAPMVLDKLRNGARARAREFLWMRAVSRLYPSLRANGRPRAERRPVLERPSLL